MRRRSTPWLGGAWPALVVGLLLAGTPPAFAATDVDGPPAAGEARAAAPADSTGAHRAAAPADSTGAPRAAAGPIENLRLALSHEVLYANNPWTIVHSFLAFGPGLKVAGGTAAMDLLKGFVRDDAGHGIHFERQGDSLHMGEMHSHLVLKDLVDLGTEPELCGRLADSAVKHFRRPVTWEDWDDTVWLLGALSRMAQFSPATPLGASGMTLRDLALGDLARLEEADSVVVAGLDQAERTGTPFRRPPGGRDPSQSGIWAYACGGQHLLQGVIIACRQGVIPASEKPRVTRQVEIFIRRAWAEAQFRDRERMDALAHGIAPAVAQHQATLNLLKLQGHGLETLALARGAGLGDPERLSAAAADLASGLRSTLADFGKLINLARYLELIRKGQPATWHLWLGDGCHALHGLSMWPALAAAG